MSETIQIVRQALKEARLAMRPVVAFLIGWSLVRAIEEHADYAEIDVRTTKDGHVVLLHDGDLMRVAKDPRKLQDLSLKQLRQLDIGSWFDPSFKDERIATLAEAVITSLEASELFKLKHEAPELQTGLIVTAVLGDATRLPVDFLSVNAVQVSNDAISLAHIRGNAVHVWTVNDEKAALRMIEMGADNLITDEPGPLVNLRQQLREMSRAELFALALRTRSGL